jgi:hypothetical protein
VGLHELENQLLKMVKHSDLHYIEEVRLWVVPDNTGNVSKHVQSSVNIAPREFGIGCLDVGIAEHSM